MILGEVLSLSGTRIPNLKTETGNWTSWVSHRHACLPQAWHRGSLANGCCCPSFFPSFSMLPTLTPWKKLTVSLSPVGLSLERFVQ